MRLRRLALAYADMSPTGGKLILGADCTISSNQTITLTADKPLFIDMAGRTLTMAGAGLTITTPTPYFRLSISDGFIVYTGTATNITGLKITGTSGITGVALARLQFSSFNTSGSIALDLNNVQDSDFGSLRFSSNVGSLKLENAANQNRFHSLIFETSPNPTDFSIFITGGTTPNSGSSDDTFDDCLVQANAALKPVQIYANAGAASINTSFHSFRKFWFEGNGDATANTRLFDMKADAGQFVTNILFEGNHFQGQNPVNFAYAWSGPGTLSYVTWINNQYGNTSTLTGFPALATSTAIGENGLLNYTAGLNTGTTATVGGGLSFNPTGAAKAYSIFAGSPNFGNDGTLMFRNLTDSTTVATVSSSGIWSLPGASIAGAGYIALGTTTVGLLPAAAGLAGQMIRVSDSTAITTEGQTCAGGGTVTALAFSNGTVWKCF